MIAGCLAWIDCVVEDEIDVGDHIFVLGRVEELEVARDAHALVFHGGDHTSTAAATFTEGKG
jgi:flavin reductase (DIM6/NTAB) family NADH-FMN oxidoreductase RutF